MVALQDPMPGEDPTAGVTLTMSEQANVPAGVVGAPVAAARTALEALGTVVQVTRAVDLTQPEGVVLSADPAPGQPLTSVVKLVIADQGDAIALANLNRVDGQGCSSTSRATLNGAAVQESPSCRVAPSSAPAYIDWLLARQGVVVQGTVGVLDSGKAGKAIVRFYGDGAVLAEVPAQFGASTPVSVNVTNVLRFKVEVVATEGEPTVVFGDGRVLGTADQIAAIRDAQ